MKKTRLFALTMALLMVVSMIAGCSAPNRPGLEVTGATTAGSTEAGANTESGYKKLTIGTDMASQSFSPTITWGNTEYVVSSMVFEPLASYDENGELAGIVAKSWTQTDDRHHRQYVKDTWKISMAITLPRRILLDFSRTAWMTTML